MKGTQYFLISYHHINRQFQQSFGDDEWSTDLTMNNGDVLDINGFKDFVEQHKCGAGTTTILNIIRLSKEEWEHNFN